MLESIELKSQTLSAAVPTESLGVYVCVPGGSRNVRTRFKPAAPLPKQIERMSTGLAKRLFTLPWLAVPPIGFVEFSKLVRETSSAAAAQT